MISKSFHSQLAKVQFSSNSQRHLSRVRKEQRQEEGKKHVFFSLSTFLKCSFSPYCCPFFYRFYAITQVLHTHCERERLCDWMSAFGVRTKTQKKTHSATISKTNAYAHLPADCIFYYYIYNMIIITDSLFVVVHSPVECTFFFIQFYIALQQTLLAVTCSHAIKIVCLWTEPNNMCVWARRVHLY